jgi:hypothetical protein
MVLYVQEACSPAIEQHLTVPAYKRLLRQWLDFRAQNLSLGDECHTTLSRQFPVMPWARTTGRNTGLRHHPRQSPRIRR